MSIAAWNTLDCLITINPPVPFDLFALLFFFCFPLYFWFIIKQTSLNCHHPPQKTLYNSFSFSQTHTHTKLLLNEIQCYCWRFFCYMVLICNNYGNFVINNSKLGKNHILNSLTMFCYEKHYWLLFASSKRIKQKLLNLVVDCPFPLMINELIKSKKIDHKITSLYISGVSWKWVLKLLNY